MSYITALGTANPSHRINQTVIADFMLKAMRLNNEDSRRLQTIFRASGIEYRYSVLEDYSKTKDFSFYPSSEDFEPFPGTADRLDIFRQCALPLSIASVKDMLKTHEGFRAKDITHLIVVCCTGMYAPGLDIELIKAFDLPSTIQRTAITFMGCYAAFNALKAADAFCKADAQAKVLIVCTELCSLHFQREPTENNLLANALFADGSAAVLVEQHSNSRLKLKIENFHNDLALNGEDDMAWSIGNFGFEMKLSAYVPDIIRHGIGTLSNTLLRKMEKKLSDIRFFAIHPGGRKILEVIEQELSLTRVQNTAAYQVLKQYGNMSSPTILFVMKGLVRSFQPNDQGEHILSFAFGPGLTLESMLLKIESV